MNRTHSITAMALTGLLGLSVISAPLTASASEQGKRNTTYALGAAAAALLLTQHNKLPGLLAAGGAAYAYSQYNNDVQARHRRNSNEYYDNRQLNGNRYNQNTGYQQSDHYRSRGDYAGIGANQDYHNNNAYNGAWNSQDTRRSSGRNARSGR